VEDLLRLLSMFAVQILQFLCVVIPLLIELRFNLMRIRCFDSIELSTFDYPSEFSLVLGNRLGLRNLSVFRANSIYLFNVLQIDGIALYCNALNPVVLGDNLGQLDRRLISHRDILHEEVLYFGDQPSVRRTKGWILLELCFSYKGSF